MDEGSASGPAGVPLTILGSEVAGRRWAISLRSWPVGRLTRCSGLAATILAAVLSWWVGALPWEHPAQLRSIAVPLAGPGWHIVGVGLGVAAVGALAWSWWLLGRLVRQGKVNSRAVATTTAVWAAPLLLAAPLGSHDVYSYACQGQIYGAGLDPYRVSAADLPCTWVTALSPIWRATTAPYGPLGIVMSGAAHALSHGSLMLTIICLRLGAVAAVALLGGSLYRLALLCRRDPAQALWLGIANPVVLIHLVGGAHHDALMSGLVVAGLVLAARGRGSAGGVLLGAAVTVKVVAAVVLPCAVLLVLVTGASRVRAATTVLTAATVTFLVLSAVSGLDLGWLAAISTASEPVSWLSIVSGVATAVGGLLAAAGAHNGVAASVAIGRTVGLYAILPATLLALWCWAARRGTTRAAVTAAGGSLAAFVVLAPVVYPWYLIAPVGVLAAVATERVRSRLAVVLLLASVVVLPDSHNLAISTLWPGGWVELAASIGLSAYAVRRFFVRRRRRAAAVS